MWEVKPYRQNDQRWSGVYLGRSVDYKIGTHGCLVTSFAMLLTALGFDETPLSVNQKLKALPDSQGFVDARFVWRGPEKIWPIRLAHVAYSRTSPADTVRIARYLERAPVLIEVQPRAQLFHWVVALGITGSAGELPEDFVIRDPLYRGTATLLTRYRVRGVRTRIDPLQLAVTAYAAYEPSEPATTGRDRSGGSPAVAIDA